MAERRKYVAKKDQGVCCLCGAPDHVLALRETLLPGHLVHKQRCPDSFTSEVKVAMKKLDDEATDVTVAIQQLSAELPEVDAAQADEVAERLAAQTVRPEGLDAVAEKVGGIFYNYDELCEKLLDERKELLKRLEAAERRAEIA